MNIEQECTGRLAAMTGRTHALLAPRATLALVAVLRALRLPAGSEVLLPATMCANPVYAVRLAGLQPLFADISPLDFNIDLQAASRRVGPSTRVLLAMPLFGHPLDVPALLSFARQHDLFVLEDAAQATGLYHSTAHPSGSVGLCSVFSFGPGKIAGAGGGAAIMADDAGLLERVQDELQAFPSARSGMAGRASSIIAALDCLPGELRTRAATVDRYNQALNLPGVVRPQVEEGRALWKYSVLLPGRQQRDAMTRALIAAGVEATNLYPPIPRFFPGTRDGEPGNYPVAYDVHDRIVNLPTL